MHILRFETSLKAVQNTFRYLLTFELQVIRKKKDSVIFGLSTIYQHSYIVIV
jgi:hypothetical protein